MIKRHGKNYWLDLWVGKKRVRRSLHTSEHALAIERARDITVELRTPKPAGTPLAEFTKTYLEWARQTKPASYGTEKCRVDILKAWCKDAGLLTLEQISTHHVEQFRAYVMTRHIGHLDKTIGRTTANRYCSLLRTMINRASDWGQFSGPNPVSKVRFYRENTRVQPLSPADVKRVVGAARAVSAAPQSPAQAVVADLIVLMLNTGLRRSEALGLRWRDLRGTDIDVIGKGERRRLVPLNATATKTILRQPRLTQFIFDIPNRLQPDNLRRTVKHIRKLSGVQHFHLHLCRHYAMTAMLGAGVDIQTAAEILGHSRLTTSLLYAHTSPERKMRAVESIVIDTDDGRGASDVLPHESAK